MRTLLPHSIFILALSVFSFSAQATELDLRLNFEDESAVSQLTNDDWHLLKKAAKKALENNPDGSSDIWRNSESSNSGVITILSTEEDESSYCRNTIFITTTAELTSTTFVNLCNKEGKWIEASPRHTTSSKVAIPHSTTSVMFNDPSSTSEIKQKSFGKTSDRCKQLANSVKELEGKILRQTVARDLYKAECLK